MSRPPHPPTEATLHAWVDGFLEPIQAAEVEKYLAEHPSEALRLEAYRQQNQFLQALRDLPGQRPFTLPTFEPRWRWRRVRPLLARAVAAVLLVAVGGAAGWVLRGRLNSGEPVWQRMVRQAEVAHLTYVPEVLHPVEVTVDQQQHLRTWLSRRLGTPIALPILAQHGYELVGGRLLPATPGPAAQFMYQDGQGNRLTLYVLAAPTGRKEAAFRYVQKGALWICYWMGASIDFALTGDVSRERLVEMAKSIYMQLNGVESPQSTGTW